jgi:hypothetical protein
MKATAKMAVTVTFAECTKSVPQDSRATPVGSMNVPFVTVLMICPADEDVAPTRNMASKAVAIMAIAQYLQSILHFLASSLKKTEHLLIDG